MDQAFIAQLQAIAETRIDAEALETYGGDWTRVHERKAGAVVFPKSTESVAQIVRLCAASQVAIVPSGGRTGLAAGAVATQGELVLSLERLAFIGDVDAAGLTLHVGAGAITEAVHQHCEAQGLTWPVDFASKGSSQVGGNIATNAGGVKVIRYGLTRNWVLGLRVVTGTGEILELNRSLEKNNTGVDLRQLFIGSEGILGIITEATLKLAPLPGHQDVMLFAVQDLPGVVRLFEAARKAPFVLSAFEMMTDRCLARLQRHRGVRPPLDVETPCYVLMEVEGERAALEGWLENALELVEDGTIAAGADQARHLWTLREGISESLSGTGLPHKNDISLPIAALPEFVTKLETRLRAEYPDFEVCLFGHIGDGNLHVNLMKPDDMAKDAFLERAHELDARMFELIAEYGGSISAEHGIGLLKKPWLSYSRSDAEIALMRALKATLDPAVILTPAKVFEA